MKKLLLLAVLPLIISYKEVLKKHENEGDYSPKKIFVQSPAEYKKIEIFLSKSDTLTKTSEPFLINDIKYYWKISLIVDSENDHGDRILELKNADTHQIALTGIDEFYDIKSFNDIDFESLKKDNLVDLNFDGYQDFSFYDKMESGSAGAFYRAYIFNSNSKIFEFKKDLSGYELTANAKDRTLSTYGKNCVDWNFRATHYFDKKGKVKYTKTIENQIVSTDNKIFLKTTYKKIVDDKIHKLKIDSTQSN